MVCKAKSFTLCNPIFETRHGTNLSAYLMPRGFSCQSEAGHWALSEMILLMLLGVQCAHLGSLGRPSSQEPSPQLLKYVWPQKRVVGVGDSGLPLLSRHCGLLLLAPPADLPPASAHMARSHMHMLKLFEIIFVRPCELTCLQESPCAGL